MSSRPVAVCSATALVQARFRRLGRLRRHEGVPAGLLLEAPGEERARHERADHHQGEHRHRQRDAAFVGQPSSSHASLLVDDPLRPDRVAQQHLSHQLFLGMTHRAGAAGPHRIVGHPAHRRAGCS